MDSSYNISFLPYTGINLIFIFFKLCTFLKALEPVCSLQISMLTATDCCINFFFFTTRLDSKFCKLQYSHKKIRKLDFFFYLLFFLFPSPPLPYQKCTVPSHHLNKGWLTPILALVIKIHYFSVMKIILMCLTTA